MTGDELKALIHEHGWTPLLVAHLVKCDMRTVKRWITGGIPIPDPISDWLLGSPLIKLPPDQMSALVTWLYAWPPPVIDEGRPPMKALKSLPRSLDQSLAAIGWKPAAVAEVIGCDASLVRLWVARPEIAPGVVVAWLDAIADAMRNMPPPPPSEKWRRALTRGYDKRSAEPVSAEPVSAAPSAPPPPPPPPPPRPPLLTPAQIRERDAAKSAVVFEGFSRS